MLIGFNIVFTTEPLKFWTHPNAPLNNLIILANIRVSQQKKGVS